MTQFVGTLPVPKTIDSGGGTLLTSLAIDAALLGVFAVQHSAMARPAFKRWWTQIVSSIAMILLFWQWRPMPAIVWQVENPHVAVAVATVSLVGWVIVFTSTFLINHFELFGLRQVTANLAGREMPQAQFRTPLYYKFVRHPLYLGFIIAFWAAPVMTVGHLLFAAVTTAYIFVGIILEERDLTEQFGDQYRQYKKRVSMLIPWRKSGLTEP